MARHQTWSMITVGDGAQYAGNTGYADDLRRAYAYDSNVANHRNVRSGDLILLRDKKCLLGIARIESIQKRSGTKTIRRCPKCGVTALKERASKRPRFRCSGGHEFDLPREDHASVSLYVARFENTFLDAPDAVPVGKIKEATPRPSDQLSIERVDIARLERTLVQTFPETRAVLASFYQSIDLEGDESAIDETSTSEEVGTDAGGQYVPSMGDNREAVLKAIKQRRGQQKFRKRLLTRYEHRCSLTGCALIDVLEAAHVWPYQGENDNHVDNGLLLRADLHTLFDLNLIAINPEHLTVEVAPALSGEPAYAALHGCKVRAPNGARPAKEPLDKRWQIFRSKWQLDQ